MPDDCSREAAAISATMSETFLTDATIFSSVWPDWVTVIDCPSTLMCAVRELLPKLLKKEKLITPLLMVPMFSQA